MPLASAKAVFDDMDGAEADFREALRIAHKSGNREGVAICTGNLAEVFLARQDWPAAERQAAEALELSKGVGRQEIIAKDHLRLAQAIPPAARRRGPAPCAGGGRHFHPSSLTRSLQSQGHAGGVRGGLFFLLAGTF